MFCTLKCPRLSLGPLDIDISMTSETSQNLSQHSSSSAQGSLPFCLFVINDINRIVEWSLQKDETPLTLWLQWKWQYSPRWYIYIRNYGNNWLKWICSWKRLSFAREGFWISDCFLLQALGWDNNSCSSKLQHLVTSKTIHVVQFLYQKWNVHCKLYIMCAFLVLRKLC